MIPFVPTYWFIYDYYLAALLLKVNIVSGRILKSSNDKYFHSVALARWLRAAIQNVFEKQ